MRRWIVLGAALSSIACASAPAPAADVPAPPTVKQGSGHDHACLSDAERKWAARQREIDRERPDREFVATPRPREPSDADSELHAAMLRGEHGEAADLGMVREVRRALMAEETLSFEAKNLKITTMDGRVTLRGTLRSTEERETVQRVAEQVVGAGKVALVR